MWFKQAKENEKDAIEMVSCEVCKAQVLRIDAKFVRVYKNRDEYYCAIHAPKYDEKQIYVKAGIDGKLTTATFYFKNIGLHLVNEQGKLLVRKEDIEIIEKGKNI